MDQISEQLLNQSKEQLDLATNSAKAVLALDKGNVEAAAILEAVGEFDVSGLESEPQSKNDLDADTVDNFTPYRSGKLRIAHDEIQSAISSRDFFKAEKLARDFIRKYPDKPGGEDLLNIVWAAMKDAQQQDSRRKGRGQKDRRTLPF